jgi:hypothetical protein
MSRYRCQVLPVVKKHFHPTKNISPSQSAKISVNHPDAAAKQVGLRPVGWSKKNEKSVRNPAIQARYKWLGCADNISWQKDFKYFKKEYFLGLE